MQVFLRGTACLLVFTVILVACKSIHHQEQADSEIQSIRDWFPRLGDVERRISQEVFEKQDREAQIDRRLELFNRYSSTGNLATKDNCPIGPNDPCDMVNIVIRFDAPGAPGIGHTGMSISENVVAYDEHTGHSQTQLQHKFYDFGPDGAVGGPFQTVPGKKWWSDSASGETLESLIYNLDALVGDTTSVRIPICIKRQQGDLLRQYWEKTFADMPEYSIPGMQCTSVVADAFEVTTESMRRGMGLPQDGDKGRISRVTRLIRYATSPESYFERIFTTRYVIGENYRHTCGDQLDSRFRNTPRAVFMSQHASWSQEPYVSEVQWSLSRDLP